MVEQGTTALNSHLTQLSCMQAPIHKMASLQRMQCSGVSPLVGAPSPTCRQATRLGLWECQPMQSEEDIHDT